MSNSIKLRPVNWLLNRSFFIPAYQRGYRWTQQQVKDLLNDIDNFNAEKCINNKEPWYCLQPLVVKEKDVEGQIQYEVIDGQQRITTIALIIHYFNEMWIGKKKLPEPIIKYQTRDDSTLFLQKIEIDGETDTITTNEFDPAENIDFYHIAEAYQTIHNWVLKKGPEFNSNLFQSKFQFNTQIIWYEISDDVNPIETFTRINMGKIPLTNSELIKALFLQKRNFKNKELAGVRQIEIANEWDKIEYTLQNNDFWWFINKSRNNLANRIEFLFNIMCDIAKTTDPSLPERIGTDHYATFRFFNEKFAQNTDFKTIEKIWNEVKSYFMAFEEWFNNPVWYHYIGFLICCNIPIKYIYNDLYKNNTKDEFLKKLIQEITNRFNSVDCTEIVKENNSIHYRINLSYENKNKQKIRELLLLFNIEYLVRPYRKQQKEIYSRFPFKLYKEEQWDIEHIDSFTENEMKDRNTQLEWLNNILTDLKKELQEDTILKEEITAFINKEKTREFVEIKRDILTIANETPNDDKDKNSIGNLTLLDAKTNRGYGNALFRTKRRIIIEKDSEGRFIPICTKNVFLKYFDKEGSSRTQWSGDDMDNYQNQIAEVILEFLTVKKSSDNE